MTINEAVAVATSWDEIWVRKGTYVLTSSITINDEDQRLYGGFSVRHRNEYTLSSGVTVGVVPSFSTVDLSMGYRLPYAQQTQLNLQVRNLFTCRNGVSTYAGDPTTTPPTPANPLQVVDREGTCGFGEKHLEMINMPQVGTMVFLGVRYQR